MEEKDRVETKWTHKGNSARKNEGWGDRGIPRFNVLMRLIGPDRERNSAVELEFLKDRKDQLNKKKSGKRKKPQEGEEEDTVPGLDSFAELDMMEIAEV